MLREGIKEENRLSRQRVAICATPWKKCTIKATEALEGSQPHKRESDTSGSLARYPVVECQGLANSSWLSMKLLQACLSRLSWHTQPGYNLSGVNYDIGSVQEPTFGCVASESSRTFKLNRYIEGLKPVLERRADRYHCQGEHYFVRKRALAVSSTERETALLPLPHMGISFLPMPKMGVPRKDRSDG